MSDHGNVSAEPKAGKRGGDPACPPGYPYCTGCSQVFEDIDDIDDHDCETDNWGVLDE